MISWLIVAREVSGAIKFVRLRGGNHGMLVLSSKLAETLAKSDNRQSYTWLKDSQYEDPKLKDLCDVDDSNFHKKMFADEELICYTEDGNDRNIDWKNCSSDTAVHTQHSEVFSHIIESPRETKTIARGA